jgi:hypothetical protein
MTDEPAAEIVEEQAKAEDNPYDVVDPATRDSDPGDENDAEPAVEEAAEPEAQPEAKEPAAPTKKPIAEPEVDSGEGEADGLPDHRKFLDEELAEQVFGIVRQQAKQIARLQEMLNGAGIMAPMEAAVSKAGDMFPDVFGKGSSPSAEQSEARTRLSEAAEIVRATYARRGKAAPGWDELIRVAMSVEFPELAQKAVAQQAKAVRRESQRIARPASREASLSPEERAVRAARKMMLESAAFGSSVPDLE